MTEIIVTSKSDLEAIVQNSVIKALQKQGDTKQEPKDKFLTMEETSEYLNLAIPTLYGFTSKRKIPFIKKGKKLYFRQSDLENWLETGRKKSREEIDHELNQK